jgi:cell wall-associated NlpC family hydrolase
MTSIRTPSSSPFLILARRAALVLLVGAGVALSPLPAQANSSGGGGDSAVAVPPAPVPAATPAAQAVVDTALAQLGKPYVWAGTGPNGYDCSGLTQFAYAAAGIHLPHSSGRQSTQGLPVARDALLPGDLVSFYNPVSHVGIYIGNGQMVHAPTSGDVVKAVNMDSMPGFNSARRLT